MVCLEVAGLMRRPAVEPQTGLVGMRPDGEGDASEGKAESDFVSSSPWLVASGRGLMGDETSREGKGSGAPSRSLLF